MSARILEIMRQICLSLPDTEETPTWGKPHFRVANKIFAGCEADSIGFKLDMEHADFLVQSDRRFTRAPYVGHKGWVSMDASGISSASDIRGLILESYRLIAPKKTLAKLFSGEVVTSAQPKEKNTETTAQPKPRAGSATKSKPKPRAKAKARTAPRKRSR